MEREGNQMEIGYRIVQEQQLKLAMTPELRQAITILQYSTPELIDFLKQQAAENPLIEVDEPELIKTDHDHWKSSHFLSVEDEEDSFDYVASSEDYVHPIDYYSHQDVTLSEYLIEQIQYMDLTIEEQKVLQFMIGNLNENGYLDVAYESARTILNVSEQLWELCLNKLHQLEPAGVGARTLEECLLIQLDHLPSEQTLAKQIVSEYLYLLATNNYKKIAKQLQVSSEDVYYAAQVIRQLLPKPGALFYSQNPRFIIPDVIVEQVTSSKYIVQLNDAILPKVSFQQQFNNTDDCRTTKQFVDKQLKVYEWIMKSISERKKTIVRVTEAIIERQLPFLMHGASGLKPLNLKEIAETLNIHESTVSRATNQKYVQTPQGIYELKYFFAHRVSSDSEETISDEQVKMKIKQLIEAENKKKPLSDQKIANELQKSNIHIARRTVAKYREELGILSSSKRKRFE